MNRRTKLVLVSTSTVALGALLAVWWTKKKTYIESEEMDDSEDAQE